MIAGRKLVDLSYSIYQEMPTYPPDPKVGIVVYSTVKSLGYNETQVLMGTHSSTHIDSPFHVVDDGMRIDEVPLEKCIGEAIVVDMTHKKAKQEITVDELSPYRDDITKLRRVILDTGWYKMWEKPGFFTEFPGITVEVAEWLVEQDIVMLGVDTPALNAHPETSRVAHIALFKNNAVLVEYLTNLDEVKGKNIFFIGLPLKIRQRDGSPIRAVAIL